MDDSTSKPISEDKYYSYFKGDKKKEAIKLALDIRKFEIELYWKRATYFWTFIAVTFAALGTIQTSNVENSTDLSVFICCLGIVFSVAWLCVNRGSKFWQENWENHVDMLEDDVYGPIYKIVLKRLKTTNKMEKLEHIINGPSPISVSKINQIISLYVSILWIFCLIYVQIGRAHV